MYRNLHVKQQDVKISDIPCSLFRPTELDKKEEGLYPTILLYHGWGSNRKNQHFKGFILASMGYQVLIPDAPYHGDRGKLNYTQKDTLNTYFSKSILSSLEEYPLLKQYLLYQYDANPSQLMIMGHSMGAIIGLRVFLNDFEIRTATLFDGAGAWKQIHQKAGEDSPLSEALLEMDPMDDIEKIYNRPLLLIHAENDSTIPIAYQRAFYNAARDAGQIQDLVLSPIEGADHVITLNAFELACEWIENYRTYDD